MILYQFMKIIKYFVLSIAIISFIEVHGQSDTIIVYDIASQTTTLIPPVSFDTAINFEQTYSSVGSLVNQVPLSLIPPVANLFSGSQFSDIDRAELFYNVTDYPIRTATHLFRYINDTLSGCCSGIMVSKNLVLTAAHCIRTYNGEWRGDSTFVAPAFDNGAIQTNIPNSMVKKYYLFKTYYDGNVTRDIALLELKEPIGEETGWVGMGFHTDTSFYSDNVFHKLSYPATTSLTDSTKIYNGDTLYYNYGLIKNFGNGLGVISPEALGIPGQSGSSLFFTDNSNYYSVGVMVFSSNYNHFRISNNVFCQFKNILDNYATGIHENTQTISSLNIFPNPASDFITIENIPQKKGAILTVYNIQGQSLIQQPTNKTSAQLNVSGLSRGLYIVKLSCESSIGITKFMKE
jgi:V8-like Glu-specific endopeptidase